MNTKKPRTKITTVTLLSLLLIILLSCAHIPKEAPELSAELGKRISSIEQVHYNLLHKFFDEKRLQIDKFLFEEWVPTFAREIFSNPKIEATWEKIVTSNNKEDRLEFIVRLGPKLQAKINAKRFELVEPLNNLESTIEQQLRDEYGQAKAINNTITSFLLSASKVEENRNRYLGYLGIEEKVIQNAIDEVDSNISSLLTSTKKALEKEKEYKNKLKSLRKSLGKNN